MYSLAAQLFVVSLYLSGRAARMTWGKQKRGDRRKRAPNTKKALLVLNIYIYIYICMYEGASKNVSKYW